MTSQIIGSIFFASLAFAVNSAQAKVLTVNDIPTELAVEAVSAAIADCSAKGYYVAVTVVDRAGQIKALQRADNAGPHTVESSRRKAYTALSMKTPTAQIMENTQKNPAAANLIHINDFLILGGGIPIKVGGDTIGAIGVAGAPGGHLDAQCGEAGIAKIKDSLK